MIEKECKICKKTFKVRPCLSETRKYCSRECKAESMKGNSGYWQGKTRWHMVGEKNHEWKKEKVGYRALHRWVERWKGKAELCEHCGKTKKDCNRIHWANKNHKYKRQLMDWISLCAKCHGAYDKSVIRG